MSSPPTAKTADALPLTRRTRPAPMPQLRLVFGPDLGASNVRQSLSLTPGGLIGRSRRCDWQLTDGHASGVHAKITAGQLEDLGSRHGSTVNGRRLAAGDRAPLTPGDVVRLGRSLFVVTPDRARPTAGATAHLFGTSPHLARVDRQLAAIDSSLARILVTGPPGAGKEHVARAVGDRIAALRERPRVPLVVFNAAAVPATLQEATLFGTTRGAFTGALRRDGLFARARGGVLFIDEIGEATPSLQATLLRAVQREGDYYPVGAERPERVAAAVVFATNRDLDEAVSAGDFRADLLSRIRGQTIALPGVDERREDLLAFVAFTLSGAEPPSPAPLPIDVALAEQLLRAPYPGHMRDLVALAERIGSLVRSLGRPLDRLDAANLGLVSPRATATAPAPPPAGGRPHRDRATFLAAWQAHGGRMSAVAQALGCDEKTARAWAIKHGLGPPGPRS